jgi:hypothetical protein
VARGVALATGNADFAEGDPARAVLALPVGAGPGEPPPHPASTTAAASGAAATSANSRDNLTP